MWRCLVILVFLSSTLCGQASAVSNSPLNAYAQALRYFNAGLDTAQSVALAKRVLTEADALQIDARFLVALIATESSWHAEATSSAGAMGLGQLMPGTASGLGVDAYDPQANIHGTAVHLRALLDRYAAYAPQERYALTLSAYNAGIGAVARYHGIPPYSETRAYVRRVLALWRRLSGAA